MEVKALGAAIADAAKLPPDEVSRLLVRTQDTKLGDYTFPCFILAKSMKIAPNICAQNLKNEIKLPAAFEKVEAVGPYLNFFFNRRAVVEKVLADILQKGSDYGRRPAKTETIIVEYSSPNIAKNLLVSHLRTTLIGLSLERIFQQLGYKVVTINHLGDWGMQFGFIWAAIQLWGMPEEANTDRLLELYIRATRVSKDQEEGKVAGEDQDKPNIAAMAREYFLRLESGDRDSLEFWKWCLDLSVAEFKEIYKRLDIEFDHYTGESFYRDQIPQVEDRIKKSGLLENSRGAIGIDLGKELGFVRIFAEDGRSLYITRDIAAAIYREETFHPEKIIYVVAAQQSLHFKQLIEVLRRINHPVADKIHHVSFGFVQGMRTRMGTVIPVKEFLDEAHSRALTTYREQVSKRPENLNEEEIAEKVGIGATYFYFLEHSNNKDFNFSWDHALNFQGDSGAYLQYAAARIYSIESNANQNGLKSDPASLARFSGDHLKESEVYDVVSLLAQFEEVIEKAAQDHEPAHLAAYALDLAKTLSKAYNTLRVVGVADELGRSRLALFIAARTVLEKALYLIGVPVIKRM